MGKNPKKKTHVYGNLHYRYEKTLMYGRVHANFVLKRKRWKGKKKQKNKQTNSTKHARTSLYSEINLKDERKYICNTLFVSKR